MAGHSHWASIKRKKGAVDAKRGKIFSKLAKAITSAARQGGGKPDMNLKLQYAIDAAKSENMPKDNIERAILKGTGELTGGTELYECLYEGYGPSGIAILIEILTDNKNRTASEIRKIFDKSGGNLGESGCVAWLFQKRGLITVQIDETSEEDLMTLVLDAGCEDLETVEEKYQIICDLKDLNGIKDVLRENDIKTESEIICWIPKNSIDLNEDNVKKVVSLMEAIENHDDVQNAYANFTIPEELLSKL
ncbi:MAG: YebC/PmpR family DNA-binding transcriptional regulator [Candidatus Scalindua sp. AMX11]|nr:MAG: YebC/PmpR family DNA-binding transcriptional regulator [Candidatus Scalindua sp.]NOG83968.1 YebC/PmpR family DNA-binding transcriptional regulator [Planctomycetota bacterium]RZV88109.1 MAG: YebC/PmpR family DNA-binding transcriptional regulator [Candidatus Scalindua sp. SCAELEC01]TDE63794.1 MAG: YebC/PmpR family DNA-binding transcriptional regulator [Candidatus Scalindua sp. AMX11]GJQ58384.1 MAG: putative transcriptional regulatory protein [Candidatus Scalindua sp.]